MIISDRDKCGDRYIVIVIICDTPLLDDLLRLGYSCNIQEGATILSRGGKIVNITVDTKKHNT